MKEMTDTNSEATLPVARACIATNEPWDPAMGWSPAPAIVDETFDYVISELGREGVSWLRLHIGGLETWFNLANVVSIGRERVDA